MQMTQRYEKNLFGFNLIHPNLIHLAVKRM